ncbi:MAG: ABC transporter ATP-binding protein [Lachnospiraceae bacterium]
MRKWLKRRFALSDEGVSAIVIGSIETALQNISFMLPVGLLFLLVQDLISNTMRKTTIVYVAGGVICCLTILIISYFQYNGTYMATYVETGKRRITLAEKLRKIPLSFFGKKDLADLTTSIMNDCDVLEKSQSHFVPPLIGSMISTTLITLMLFIFNWKMALAILWVLPVSFIIILCSSKVQNKFMRKTSDAKIDYEAGIQECIEAANDLHANNAEKEYLDQLERKIEIYEKYSVWAEFGKASFITASGLVLRLGTATTILVGSGLLIGGSMDLLTFLFFMLIVSRIYDPLDASLQNLAMIISTNTNIERINEIHDQKIQDGSKALTNHGYDISFENVEFSYENGEKVLAGVSFTAKQGEVTALVGPSGGGKTTVSRLAARFWDITKGQITIGGMDISKTDPETLMSIFSIVFQDVTLFNNTILENIRIGNPNATDKEVIAAAKLANVDEFAEKLPEKWNAMIGENGSQLSGGERQRISIARAFLKNAPIILLDEATASLDVENETLIQTALSKLIKNKTVLIIAHRMRSIAAADQIIVLKDGILSEKGSPNELLKQSGIFANMCRLQAESSDWTIVS